MTVSWSKVCGLVSLTMLLAAPAWAGKEDDTLNIAWREELPTYDAYYASPRESVLLARLVWDNLVDRDPVTFEYKPLLAESYEWIDEKTLEFPAQGHYVPQRRAFRRRRRRLHTEPRFVSRGSGGQSQDEIGRAHV